MEIQQHTKVTDLRGRSALTRSLEFGAFAPATGRPGFDKFTRFRLVLQVYVEGKTSLFFFFLGGGGGGARTYLLDVGLAHHMGLTFAKSSVLEFGASAG